MLRHVLAKFQSAILEHPRAVLVLSGALLVLAIILGLGVEFRTSRSELAPEDDPEQQRMNRFVEETGGGDLLIACARRIKNRRRWHCGRLKIAGLEIIHFNEPSAVIPQSDS